MHITAVLCVLGAMGAGRGAVPDGGAAACVVKGDRVRLENGAIAAEWRVDGAGVELAGLVNKFTHTDAKPNAQGFALERRGAAHERVKWKLDQAVREVRLESNAKAARRAEQSGGRAVVAEFRSSDGWRCIWQAELRDGANYVRQVVTLRAEGGDADVERVVLMDAALPGAVVRGECPGSPIVAGAFFAGFEHPMAESRVDAGRARSWLRRAIPLRKGQAATYSSVIGVAPAGQMRRAFLAYVERERAHPYRPFLHYNSWYDLGAFAKFDERQCVEVIRAYGRELVEKRKVRMDSFLFDDGWDNYESLWEFHEGFPHGFLPLKAEAEKFGAAPGVWLSPWGGYGGPRERRLAFGKAHGYEVDSQGYALSGPKYYARFHDVTREFVTKYGINQFKFDGTGSPDKTCPGSAFDSDFDAAIHLIADLREARPDLFINLTTGTWPSPFWLRHADSTWRGGEDHSFAGVGSDRQRWITYRDADTYRGVVRRGPLYPINSLMLHGVIYAPHAQHLDSDPKDDFRDEVRAYFGSGTQLQELYVSPKLLTQQNWDDLAEAARWSRGNADVLVDVHWVGGDPDKLDVYGWAAWSPRKGILVLRNPAEHGQAFSVDLRTIFELPDGEGGVFVGRSPYRSDAGQAAVEMDAGKSRVIDLKAFEVRVLEFVPRS